MIFAGQPAITTFEGKLLVTTELAPTVTLSPNSTPGKIVTEFPNQQFFPIFIEDTLYFFLFKSS